MKYNEETTMNPLLIREIQNCLECLPSPIANARLGGIAIALHALTGTQWGLIDTDDGQVFMKEDATEAICRESIDATSETFDLTVYLFDKVFAFMDEEDKALWTPEEAENVANDIDWNDGIEADPDEVYDTIAAFIAQEEE